MLVKSFLAAMATYSAIPTPRTDWDERSLKYALCFFPAVGVVCGLVLWAWYAICQALDVGGVLFAAVAVCLPLLLTGGIHMDGYMDTADALSSRQSRERKLEILKDPHCGAFAVLYCAVYLLLQFGLLHALYGAGPVLLCLCPIYVLSRALSALCAVTMPNARGNGMLHAVTERTAKWATICSAAVVAAIALVVTVLLAPLPGLCSAVLALLIVPAYRALTGRQFGGVTGDTAGFFLQICELAALLGVWIGGLL